MVNKDHINAIENHNGQTGYDVLVKDLVEKCNNASKKEVKFTKTSVLRKVLDETDDTDDEMDFPASDDSDTSDLDTSYQERSTNGLPVCRGCTNEINEKYYLRVNQTSWHEDCLKCNICNVNLEKEETCFVKKKQILCKIDYFKQWGIKCAKCSRSIQSSDWIRRAKDNVYHLACFACDTCKRQLSTGEEFALQNNKLLCKTHFCENIDVDNGLHEDDSKSKNKRIRTTFTDEQLQVLQANFDVDSNPDGQDLERIAQTTGLSKRVTQVWFQNSRARQKKDKEKKTSSCDNESNDASSWTNDTAIQSTSTTKKRAKSHLQHATTHSINDTDMNMSCSSESPSDANFLDFENDSMI